MTRLESIVTEDNFYPEQFEQAKTLIREWWNNLPDTIPIDEFNWEDFAILDKQLDPVDEYDDGTIDMAWWCGADMFIAEEIQATHIEDVTDVCTLFYETETEVERLSTREVLELLNEGSSPYDYDYGHDKKGFFRETKKITKIRIVKHDLDEEI